MPRNRIRQAVTGTGTGSLTLSTAETGYRTLQSAFSSGDVVKSCVVVCDDGTWEIFNGTYTSPSTIARTTFLDSSTGSPIDFTSANKYLFVDLLSDALIALNNLTLAANASATDILTALGGEAPTGTGAVVRHTSPVFDTLMTLLATALGASPTDSTAIKACNTTAASSGNQQYSPAILLEGQCWETTGGTSQSVKSRVILQPVQGSTSTFNLLFQRSINGGGYTTFLTVGSNGAITSTNIISAASYLTTAGFCQVGSAQYFLIDSRLRLQASSNGVSTLTRADGTTPAQLSLANVICTTKSTLAGTDNDDTVHSPASGGTATLDCSVSNTFQVNRPTSGNITITLSNTTKNQTVYVRVATAGSGTPGTVTISGTLTWLSNNGSAPTFGTAINQVDAIMFRRISSGVYDAWLVGANHA